MKRALAEFNNWMEESSGYYSLYMDWSPAVLFWTLAIGGFLIHIVDYKNETIMAAVGCVWAVLVFGAAAFIVLLAAEFLLWYLLAREPRKGDDR